MRRIVIEAQKSSGAIFKTKNIALQSHEFAFVFWLSSHHGKKKPASEI